MAKRRGNGEGSIWKENNSWRTAITIDGHRLTKSFQTKAECKDWIREFKNKMDRGLTFNTSNITLQDFMGKWLPVHLSRLRHRTGPQYMQLSQDYILPTLGKVKLKDLNLEQVEALYQQLLRKGNSARTVQFVHAVLRRCLKEAVRRGLMWRNPTQGAILPRIEREEMRILDENQVVRFLITAQESPYAALYHLAIKAGMRKGELLGLKWEDLDWDKGLLRVQRQVQRVSKQGLVFTPPKTRSGRRTIQLGIQMLRTLQDHNEKQKYVKMFAGVKWQDHGMIFTSSIGTPVDQSNLDRDFKAILKKADLEEIRFHDLRHTAASLMLNNGIPALVVSKILGHAKVSTTLDIYGHLVPVMQSEAARIMDELITPIVIQLANPEPEPTQNQSNVKEFPE